MQTQIKSAVILLIEDDPGDQKITKRAFRDSKIRNELRIVNDGEEALDFLFRKGNYKDPEKSPRPDLILLDLNMPKVDGRQVLEKISLDPVLSRIRTIVLTTSRQEEDIIRSYNLGIQSFITKPVDFLQFVNVIKTIGEYWFQIVVLPPN